MKTKKGSCGSIIKSHISISTLPVFLKLEGGRERETFSKSQTKPKKKAQEIWNCHNNFISFNFQHSPSQHQQEKMQTTIFVEREFKSQEVPWLTVKPCNGIACWAANVPNVGCDRLLDFYFYNAKLEVTLFRLCRICNNQWIRNVNNDPKQQERLDQRRLEGLGHDDRVLMSSYNLRNNLEWGF